jgi:CheY-like chemotaxis protein
LPSEQSAFALVEHWRAAPQTRDLPIVMLSGTGSPYDARRAAYAGCDQFVTIPCAPDDVLWIVCRAIARRRFKTPRMIRSVAAEMERRSRIPAASLS